MTITDSNMTDRKMLLRNRNHYCKIVSIGRLFLTRRHVRPKSDPRNNQVGDHACFDGTPFTAVFFLSVGQPNLFPDTASAMPGTLYRHHRAGGTYQHHQPG